MSTINQVFLHAAAFLKVASTYASAADELRLANTVEDLITNYARWHWNSTAGQDVGIALGGQDYSLVAADQNKVLAIQDAYLTDATFKYPRLAVDGKFSLPITDDTGRPLACGLITSSAIRFWPAANASYTFKWRYYKRGTVHAANSETWDVPTAYEGIIKTGMIWQLFEYQDDVRAGQYEKRFYAMLENLARQERVAAGRIT